MLPRPTLPIVASLVTLLVACATESAGPTATGDDELVARPSGCVPITLGALADGVQLPQAQYGQQPTFRGPLASPIGDPVRVDEARVRVDAATRPGTYRLEGAASCYEKGAECVVVGQDLDPATQIAARTFAAVAGKIELGAQITPDERVGRLRHVELREITIAKTNVPWRAATIVAGGACLWIEDAKLDTRRPDGCDPTAASTCGSGRTCLPRNAAGSDGSCVTAGTRATGESCAVVDGGGSDCLPGHRCIDVGAGTQCTRTCDILAPHSGCPDATACSAFGLCRPEPASDPAQIGESCAAEEGPCGRDGARGTCFVLYGPDDQPWNGGSKCWGYGRARSACAPGDDLGYVAYAQGRDRSLGVCTPVLR